MLINHQAHTKEAVKAGVSVIEYQTDRVLIGIDSQWHQVKVRQLTSKTVAGFEERDVIGSNPGLLIRCYLECNQSLLIGNGNPL